MRTSGIAYRIYSLFVSSFGRLRVEHMERQLANLTGLVQKALTQTVPTPSPRERDLSVSSGNARTISSPKTCIQNFYSF